MTCLSCGCDLPENAAFCVRCGSPAQPSRPRDPSLAAQFPDNDVAPTSLRVNGKRFIVPRGAILPSRCVKCSNSPAEPWLKLTFTWHHPGLYLLLISPIVYIIVAAIVRKRVTLAVPLCEAHKTIRKSRLTTGALLMLGSIPIAWALGAYADSESIIAVAWLLGFVLFFTGAVFLIIASPLKAARIGSESAELTGAKPSFLAAVAHAGNLPSSTWTA